MYKFEYDTRSQVVYKNSNNACQNEFRDDLNKPSTYMYR